MRDVEAPSDELDLRDYLAVLRRRAGTIAVVTALAVVAAVGLSLLATPQYSATAEVLIPRQSAQDLVESDTGEQRRNANSEAQRIQTEVEVMRSRSVQSAVRQELGRTPSVRITIKGPTSVVSISATDTDPERAAAEANAYASIAIALRSEANVAVLESAAEVLYLQVADIDELMAETDQAIADLQAQLFALPEDDPGRASIQAQIDTAVADRDAERAALLSQRAGYIDRLSQLQLSINGAQADEGGRVISEAVPPSQPFAPDPLRNTLIALVFGLLAGAVVAFLRDYLDDRIRSKDDLDRVTGGVDVLGLVPRVERWRDRSSVELVSASAPSSPAAEAYRSLRTSLQFVGLDREVRVIQVTSSVASEGKTTTLSNLGVVLARAGHEVVLVDGDLRRPRLHQFFGMDLRSGFSTAVLDDDLAGVIHPVSDVPRLNVVASGPTPPNPSELLATRRAGALFSALADRFDYVLIDSPPLLPVADAVILAGYADATLLVATVNTTTKRSLSRSLEILRQADAPLVGIVLNGLNAHAAYSYGYGGEPPAEGESWWPFRRRDHEPEPEPIGVPVPYDVDDEPDHREVHSR